MLRSSPPPPPHATNHESPPNPTTNPPYPFHFCSGNGEICCYRHDQVKAGVMIPLKNMIRQTAHTRDASTINSGHEYQSFWFHDHHLFFQTSNSTTISSSEMTEVEIVVAKLKQLFLRESSNTMYPMFPPGQMLQ